MTPDRFRECIAALYWSQRHVADILERDPRLIRRWATGRYEIDSDVAAWLETLGRCAEANPPPRPAPRDD